MRIRTRQDEHVFLIVAAFVLVASDRFEEEFFIELGQRVEIRFLPQRWFLVGRRVQRDRR